MSLIDFLQTPAGLQLTAFVTVWVIGAAFLLGCHPFKKEKRLVIGDLYTGPYVPEVQETKLWVAGDYFTFLSSLIRSSATLEDLAETMPLIENFFDKPFRVPVSNYQLKRYYARLLQVYCAREKELEHIPVAICKN
jgi:hypothetical protein